MAELRKLRRQFISYTKMAQLCQRVCPVTEERSIVAVWLLVVHVMSWCSSKKTKRYQMVEGPRHVVTNVILYRHPDAEHCHTPCSQRVAAKKYWVLVTPESNSHELRDAELFS
ncbi:hypothetical protein WMY93_023526 [Mugilogobius chulae]|uniref:Uncharacterized protein n=1 Tax=Mugilogobius chulae TaxID=88201 RepID=A0AAW0NF17_9GOBI